MYKDIRSVLDAEDITYYAAYGTALGAVRENGIIPWDDDLDLAVRHEELPRVRRALLDGLDKDKYYFHDPRADTHPHVILRTDDMESDLREKRAPFIDLFVIEDYPDRKSRIIPFGMMLWGLNLTIALVDAMGSVRAMTTFGRVARWFDRQARRACNRDTGLVGIFCTTPKETVIPRDWISERRMFRFEDTDIPLPARYDDILRQMYGDYMTPPKEGKRTGSTGYPCGAYADYILDKNERPLRVLYNNSLESLLF